jgi:hypothetical protein
MYGNGHYIWVRNRCSRVFANKQSEALWQILIRLLTAIKITKACKRGVFGMYVVKNAPHVMNNKSVVNIVVIK